MPSLEISRSVIATDASCSLLMKHPNSDGQAGLSAGHTHHPLDTRANQRHKEYIRQQLQNSSLHSNVADKVGAKDDYFRPIERGSFTARIPDNIQV